jgi:RIO kinase 2
MLGRWREVEEPTTILKEILVNVRKAYLEAGVVHGDLSEYNVLLNPDMSVLIIDWPQYVQKTHPNAGDMLLRDVKNVTDFFMRKFRVKIKVEDALSFVLGETENIAL